MIAYAGMSDKLSNLCYYNNNEYSFNRPYSEKTAETIDNEVHAMINEQYERAKELLREHKDGHAELAKILMEREVIFAEDVEKIFGKRPWTSRSEEIFGNGNNSEAAEVVDAQQENQENTTEAADTVTA
jgi:cell division protease FtsH